MFILPLCRQYYHVCYLLQLLQEMLHQRENRRQCCDYGSKGELFLSSQYDTTFRELEYGSEASLSISYSRRSPRTERPLNDLVREMEGMLVDEYRRTSLSPLWKVVSLIQGNAQLKRRWELENKGFLAGDMSENHSKRRRTADGFALYSTEELGIGNPDADSTSLCPFDCTCCF
ncbi:HUA2-like protein 2 [Platanthera guangdongensis]|uniref:HUA2-like protein 2 n=1 Tax=Platanthera guangdongensis TaxID=2320717 RepID=A0ABR2LTT3_9ASPA